MLACKYGHKEVVKLLLEHSNTKKIELNVKDTNGQTAFILACYNGHIDVVKLCLDYSEVLDVNVPEIYQLSEAIMDLLKFQSIK